MISLNRHSSPPPIQVRQYDYALFSCHFLLREYNRSGEALTTFRVVLFVLFLGNGSCNFGQSGSGSNPPPAGSGAPKPLARGGKKWCIAKQQARVQDLQANLNFVCDNQGVDCGPIQPGGACFDEDVRARASYAMNSYYQVKGGNDFNCDFSGTGLITITDPSTSTCFVHSLLPESAQL